MTIGRPLAPCSKAQHCRRSNRKEWARRGCLTRTLDMRGMLFQWCCGTINNHGHKQAAAQMQLRTGRYHVGCRYIRFAPGQQGVRCHPARSPTEAVSQSETRAFNGQVCGDEAGDGGCGVAVAVAFVCRMSGVTKGRGTGTYSTSYARCPGHVQASSTVIHCHPLPVAYSLQSVPCWAC